MTMHKFPAMALSVVTAAFLLSACGRDDGQTAGQKMDSAVGEVEKKANEMAADTREAGREVGQAAKDATAAVADKTRDVTITAEVNARLARDPGLSAMAINVDTAEGRVMLRGTAPDSTASERATELAKGVDGVVAVDNELTIQAAK